MRRRTLLTALAAALLVHSPVYSRAPDQWWKRSNGWYDPNRKVFVWDNGGGDPLRLSMRDALELPDVRRVVPDVDRAALLRKIEDARKGPPNYEVQDGDYNDLMISGRRGWVAWRVEALPSKWKPGASREALVVYHTGLNGHQYRVTFFRVCENLSLTRFGAPLQC